MPDVDDRTHDHLVLGACEHAGDEGLIDLDLVDRELLQLRQRGKAGAEVVDRDLHPEGAERRQRGSRQGPIRHHFTFGDLEDKLITGHAVLTEQTGDEARQPLVEEVAHGQVHRDGEVETRGSPARQVAYGPFDHPPRERLDQARQFAELDELVRCQKAELPVAPTDQPFGADDVTGA